MQKHTGRARAGTNRSPIWKGGGVVFGPRPRDYSYSMHRKAKKVALQSALLSKLKDNEVMLIDKLVFDIHDLDDELAVRAYIDDLEDYVYSFDTGSGSFQEILDQFESKFEVFKSLQYKCSESNLYFIIEAYKKILSFYETDV